MPDEEWYAFCKRRPEIKEWEPQLLEKERTTVSLEMMENVSGLCRTIFRRKLIIMNSLLTIQDGHSMLLRVYILYVVKLERYLCQLAPNMFTKFWQMIKLRQRSFLDEKHLPVI